MKNLRITLTILIIFFQFDVRSISDEIKIKFKIGNEIVTNKDILQEAKYLLVFNKNLEELSQDQIYEIAVKSIIQERIKGIEVRKYFDLYEKNPKVEKIILETINQKIKLDNINKIEQFSINNKLNFEDLKSKYKIELYWNKLIYDKYYSKVRLDQTKLKNKIIEDAKSSFVEEFLLHEILFDINDGEVFNLKYEKILKKINLEGFDVAATNFSKSKTAFKGGEIGWILKSQISERILKNVKNLKIGEISKPIAVGNGFLLIKLVDKKKSKNEIDIDKELKILMEKETDRQLTQYSTNFFNKIKQNIFINEL